MKKKKKSLIIWAIVTIIIAVTIAFCVDWKGVFSAIARVRVSDVLLSVLFIHLSKLAYAAKWSVLAPDFSFGLIYHTVLGSMPLFLLPAGGFVSDGYRIAALTGRGHDYSAISSILFDRLTMPLSILCICLPLAVISGNAFFPFYIYIILALVAVAALGCVVLLLSKYPRQWLIKKTSAYPKVNGLISNISGTIDSMGIGPKRIVLTVLLGFCGDLLTSGAYFAYGSSLGINLPISKWLFVYTLPIIANTAVPTAGGIGVRDATLIAFFSIYAIDSSAAVSLSALFVGSLALSALIGLFVHWVTKPIYKKSSKT